MQCCAGMVSEVHACADLCNLTRRNGPFISKRTSSITSDTQAEFLGTLLLQLIGAASGKLQALHTVLGNLTAHALQHSWQFVMRIQGIFMRRLRSFPGQCHIVVMCCTVEKAGSAVGVGLTYAVLGECFLCRDRIHA